MDVMRVPIYPSVDVVFPGQLLVLRSDDDIVVPMVQTCVRTQQPLGVTLVSGAQGHNVARVGTLAYVLGQLQGVELDYPHVAAVGRARFRMLQLHHDRAYMEATVRVWPWASEPHPSWEMIELFGVYLRRYVAALSEILPPALLPEALPPDAAALGVLGAALLQLPHEEKQRLLELTTTHKLLEEVLRYMRVYVPMAERLADRPPQILENYERISLN